MRPPGGSATPSGMIGLVAVDVDPDGGACVHRIRDGLDTDPKPGEARKVEALHAEFDQLRDIGGVQDRNFRVHEGKVALVRQGRGFAGMIVAREGENAAVARRAEHRRVLEGVARPVHARPFAVPDAENAVIAGAGEQPDLLAAPYGCRRQFLVDARLEDNVMIGETLALVPKLFVIRSKWRTAIARNKSCRVQAILGVNFTAQQRKPDKSLNAGNKDLAALDEILVVEADGRRINKRVHGRLPWYFYDYHMGKLKRLCKDAWRGIA